MLSELFIMIGGPKETSCFLDWADSLRKVQEDCALNHTWGKIGDANDLRIITGDACG